MSGVVGRMRQMYGNSAHRWMYDYALWPTCSTRPASSQIRRCKFGDADDPMFAQVEEEGRFHDTGNEELAVEARRPMVR